jgi:SAM-dependent methyltransferase
MFPAMLPRILDVGCGRDKLPGALGIDRNPRSHAEIIHDLERRPWPLPDDSFDEIRAHDVLEHLHDFIGAVEEIHRVARAGAIVSVRMPFMSSVDHATDPTHVRAATSRTFDYFDPKKPLGALGYSDAHLEIVDVRFARSSTPYLGMFFRRVDKWIVIPLAERFCGAYEMYFGTLYPMAAVTFTLRVRKPAR